MKLTDLPEELLCRILYFTLPAPARQLARLRPHTRPLYLRCRIREPAPDSSNAFQTAPLSYSHALCAFAHTHPLLLKVAIEYHRDVHVAPFGAAAARDPRSFAAMRAPRVALPLRSLDVSVVHSFSNDAMRDCLRTLQPTLRSLSISVTEDMARALRGARFVQLSSVSLAMRYMDIRALSNTLAALSTQHPNAAVSCVRELYIGFIWRPGCVDLCENAHRMLTHPRLDSGLTDVVTEVLLDQDWHFLNIRKIKELGEARLLRMLTTANETHRDLVSSALSRICTNSRAWEVNKGAQLDHAKSVIALRFSDSASLSTSCMRLLLFFPQLREIGIGLSGADMPHFQQLCRMCSQTLKTVHVRYYPIARSRRKGTSEAPALWSAFCDALFELNVLEEMRIESSRPLFQFEWDILDFERFCKRMFDRFGRQLRVFKLRFHDSRRRVSLPLLLTLYAAAASKCTQLAQFEIKLWRNEGRWRHLHDVECADSCEGLRSATRVLHARLPTVVVE